MSSRRWCAARWTSRRDRRHTFAVVPLVRFTGERRKMGEFANGRLLSVVAWSVAVVIGGLNGWLLVQTGVEWL
jgi:manganese transport protein